MKIMNSTRFSKEGFFSLHKCLTRKSYIPCIIFEVILLAVAIFIAIDQKDYLKPILIGVLMIAYPFILTLIMKSQISRSYLMNKQVYDQMIYEYEFNDDQFTINLIHNDKVNNGHVSYNAIYKLVETDKFLFIFIASNQAYIVDKSSFENEDDCKIIVETIKTFNIKHKYVKV